MLERGIKSVAVTFTNNDYGARARRQLRQCLQGQGRQRDRGFAHDDGKGDYSAEVAALAMAGGDALVAAGYAALRRRRHQTCGALDTCAFETSCCPTAW